MTFDMQYFNVYYFCHLANESMGKIDYASTNAEFTEGHFEGFYEDFPKISVLRAYCYWLVDRIFYEQANLISNTGEISDFNPIAWIHQAALKYTGVVLPPSNVKMVQDDYLDAYNEYVEHLENYEDGIYSLVIDSIAKEVEYILFKIEIFFCVLMSNRLQRFVIALEHEYISPSGLNVRFFLEIKDAVFFAKKI